MEHFEVDAESGTANPMSAGLKPAVQTPSGINRVRDFNSPYLVPVAKIIHQLERQPGLKEVDGSGFYGEHTPRILTYDPWKVRTVAVPFTNPDLTVCYNFGIWMYHLGFLLYAIVLMFFLAATSFGDGAEGGGAACSDDHPNQNLDICSLNKELTSAKDDFRWLIAFILAGYVGISLSMWQSRRLAYAVLCGK
jgi:hypothetical protein